jgi:hypothetical protein
MLMADGCAMIDPTDPNSGRLAYWHSRRRRRLAFMVGRYLVLMAIFLAVGWLTGGVWLRGLALIATVLLALRLAFFLYNGRHLEERLAKRTSRRS